MRTLVLAAAVITSLIPLTACGDDSDESGDKSRLEYVDEACDVDNIGDFDGELMHLTQGNALEGYVCVLHKLDIEEQPWNSSTSASGTYEANGLEIFWQRSYMGFETNYGKPEFEATFPEIELQDPADLPWLEHYETYGVGSPESDAAAALPDEPAPPPSFMAEGRLKLRSGWKKIATSPNPQTGGVREICTGVGPYADVKQGASVVVRNPSNGEVVDRGNVGTGYVVVYACEFKFSAMNVPSGLPGYELDLVDGLLTDEFTEADAARETQYSADGMVATRYPVEVELP